MSDRDRPSANLEREAPSDVLRLVVGIVLLVALLIIQWRFGDTLTSFAAELFRGVSAIPSWILNLAVVGARVLVVVLFVTGTAWALWHRRWRLFLTVGAAALLAVVVNAVLDLFAPEGVAAVASLGKGLGPLTAETFPSAAGLAAAAAAVTSAAPWASRTWRRAAWLMVFALIVARFLVSPVSFDTVRGALIGWVAGAAVLVLTGAPSRRPTSEAIAAGLAGVGVPMASLEPASVDARGSTPYFGVTADGQRVFVKALGQDQRSADLLFRIYRRVKRHNLGDERAFSSLRRGVEHEALVALAARDLGVRTPRLVAFATAEPNGYVLAYEAIEGKSLDRLQPDDITDDVVAGIWEQLLLLRRHRVAHRDLRLANVFLAADGRVWLIDFGFSELAASDVLLNTDVAEFVASSALQVGVARAVAHAHAAVGSDGLVAALGRLQLWALSGATRTSLKERSGLLDSLRQEMTTTAAPA